jgi:hypothetical protein
LAYISGWITFCKTFAIFKRKQIEIKYISNYNHHGVFHALLYNKCTTRSGILSPKTAGATDMVVYVILFLLNLLLALHSPCNLRHFVGL